MRVLWQFLHTSFGFGIHRFSSSLQANLSSGHYQQEHETSHGFMSHTRWVIDSPEGNITELDKHKFPAKDDGAPMLCNLACISIGRHVHIDSCHGDPHDDPQVQHIKERLAPNPDQAKDWITHDLYWRRMGQFTTRFFFLAYLSYEILRFQR
jgi:hypothetical protein